MAVENRQLCESSYVARVLPLSAVAAVVLGTACTIGPEQRSAPAFATWRPIASWSGHGNSQLETFMLNGGRMRITWETRNERAPGTGHFKVRVHSADSGRVLAEPIDVRGAAHETTEVVDDHQRFYLSVESSGVDWTITVEEAFASQR